eukprot:4491765-Lingulodinium_polyedra.AAC.1
MSVPAASALSSSMANSRANSSAPRLVGPARAPTHAAKSLARPADHTRYTMGSNHTGRRCTGSAWSPPGLGSRTPSGSTAPHSPRSSMA